MTSVNVAVTSTPGDHGPVVAKGTVAVPIGSWGPSSDDMTLGGIGGNTSPTGVLTRSDTTTASDEVSVTQLTDIGLSVENRTPVADDGKSTRARPSVSVMSTIGVASVTPSKVANTVCPASGSPARWTNTSAVFTSLVASIEYVVHGAGSADTRDE